MDILPELRATAAVVANDMAAEPSPERAERLAIGFANLLDRRLGPARLPAKHESVAVTTMLPKTAALMFERVWDPNTPLARGTPDSIATYGATDVEIWLVAIALINSCASKEVSERFNRIVYRQSVGPIFNKPGSVIRDVSEALTAAYGMRATSLYPDAVGRDAEYVSGDHNVTVAALSEIHVVDESALTWEQVEQFRQDTDARRHYRRLVHWLDAEMAGRTTSFIADEMSERLENYEAALRKHGIQTALGSLAALIDPGFLAAASVAVSAAAVSGGGIFAAITAGGLALARGAISVISKRIDLRDEVRKTSEIAFIHELKEKMARHAAG